MLALAVVFLLSACAPNFQKKNDVVQTDNKTKENAIIPKYKISDKYYRTILPFQPGETRGMVVNNLNTRYDINEFETGLMRIAQKQFDPNKYLFREGQEIKKETVKLWLNRKFNKAQLDQRKLKDSENIGLNPQDDSGDNSTPIYLAHILEHDYLIKDSNNKVQLGGVVIGLAMNTTYYYQTVQYGPTYEKKLSDAEVEAQGKKIAAEVLNRLRAMKDLKDVPITIALFKTESKTSIVPGNFFAYANASKGSSSLGSWQKVNEKYYLFPSAAAQDAHRDDLTSFLNFKQDVEQYFPNFTGAVGKAFYVDDQLQDLTISIPIQFYGKTEAIGFTQYVTGLVMQQFPKYISVSVSVTSVDGPEALIVRKSNQSEPFVYIY